MVFMEWKNEWDLGFKGIDAQHKELVDLINRAHDSFLKNKKIAEEIFNELISLSRVHFSTEEKYFEEFDYENKEEHMEKHAELIKDLLNFKDDFDGEDFNLEEFLKFLSSWFDNHCNNYDKGYVKCFKEHGLK